MIINKIPYFSSEKTNINNASATVSDFTYNGSEKNAGSTLVLTYAGNTLVEGTDYITGGEKTAVNAGTYTIEVTGIGAFTGAKAVSWTIGKAWHNANTVEVVAKRKNSSGATAETISKTWTNTNRTTVYALNDFYDVGWPYITVTITPDANTSIIKNTAKATVTKIGTGSISSTDFSKNSSGQLVAVSQGSFQTWGSGAEVTLYWESENYKYQFTYRSKVKNQYS